MGPIFTIGPLIDIEYTVKNIYELVKKVIEYKDSTVKKKKENHGINNMFMWGIFSNALQ